MSDGSAQFDINFKMDDIDLRMKKVEEQLTAVAATAEQTESRTTNAIRNTARQTQDSAGGIEGALHKAGAAFLAFMTVDAGLSFVSSIISVRSEFEKYLAVLKTSYGDTQRATDAMTMLTDIASNTPFQLTELTGAFVKLKNQGFEPTRAEIIKLGDLASSTGKGFDQLAEGILDASMGEWERMKDFGIKASQSGDKVTISFKGVKSTIDNTADSIRRYITELGGMAGVTGSMAGISNTLGGRVSNLKDAWDVLLNSLGNSDAWKNAISFVTDFANKLTSVIKGSEQLATESARSNVLTFQDSLKGLSEDDAFTKITNKINKLRQLSQGYGEENLKIKNNTSWSDIFSLGTGLENTSKKNFNEQRISELAKEEKALKDLLADYQWYEKINPKTIVPKEQLGIIETLEKNLASLQAARKKALSAEDISVIDKDIEAVKKQLAAFDVSGGKIDALKAKISELNKEYGAARTNTEIQKAKDRIKAAEDELLVLENLQKFEQRKEKVPEKIKPIEALSVGKVITKPLSFDFGTHDPVTIEEQNAEGIKKIVARSEAERVQLIKDAQEEVDRIRDGNRSKYRKMLDDIFSLDNTYHNAGKNKDEAYYKDKGKIAGEFLQGIGNDVEQLGNVLSTIDPKIGGIASALGGIATGFGKLAAGDIVGGIGSLLTSVKQLSDATTQDTGFLDRMSNMYAQQHSWLGFINDDLQKQLEILKEIKGIGTNTAYEASISQTAADNAELLRKMKTLGISGSPFVTQNDPNNARKGYTAYDITGLSPKEIQALIDAANKNIAETGKNKATVGNLIISKDDLDMLNEYMDAYNAGVEQLTELENTYRETVTGSTYESIVQSISDGFADGTLSAEEFSTNFETIMKKAIMRSFEQQFLETQLQGWYTSFADLSKDGLSEADVAKLRLDLKKITDDAQQGIKLLTDTSGLDLSSTSTTTTDTSQSSLTGAIKSIQEDTANVLAGTLNAIRITALEQRTIAMDSYQQFVKIEINTKQTAMNTLVLLEMRDIMKANSSNQLIIDRANGI